MAFPTTFILVYYIDKIGDVMIAIAYHLRRNPLGDRYDLAVHHQYAMIVARQMALHHNAAAMLYRDLEPFPDLCFTQQCRSEEHTSELQSLMRISYAVFCLKKKKQITTQQHNNTQST